MRPFRQPMRYRFATGRDSERIGGMSWGHHLPAAAGMAGIVASAVAADVWATRTGRPTISATVATILEHPVGGVAVIAGLAGLGWHLAVDPVVRRLERT